MSEPELHTDVTERSSRSTAMPKTSAARADAEIVVSAATIPRQLSETPGELERLRALLDTKLTELEAALDNPDASDSLERLVIDLARVATREADAAATRAALEAQRAADEQVSRARVDADLAVRAERSTAGAARAELDAARTALDAERANAAAVNRRIEELDAALAAGRAAVRSAEASAEAAEQRLFVVETMKEREFGELRDEFALDHELQRTNLEQTVDALRLELAAARDVVDRRQGELDALLRRMEAAEQRAIDSEQQRRDAELRAEAARADAEAHAAELDAAREAHEQRAAAVAKMQERLDAGERRAAEHDARQREDAEAIAGAMHRDQAALTAQLEAAREAHEQRAAAMAAMQERLDAAERRAAEHDARQREEAEAIADAMHRDQAALTADLDAARQAAHAASETAREALKAASELRAQLEFADAERANIEGAVTEAKDGLDLALRARDDARAELAASRDAAHAASAAAEARYDELRGSSAVRIQDLEAELTDAQAIRPASAHVTTADDDTEHDLGEELWSDDSDVIDISSAAPAAHAPSLMAPTRRTERHRVSDDVEVLVDDLPATLVDLSVNGAQILSPTALKPNRAIAFMLPVDGRSVLCRGKVVWASFEASSGALIYRGGIFFTEVDPAAIKAFVAGTPYDPRPASSVAEIEAGQSLSADTDTKRHNTSPAATNAMR
jgi:uncharacterized coiled-coil protein SlyX